MLVAYNSIDSTECQPVAVISTKPADAVESQPCRQDVFD
jgi:hypothetical protein